MGTLVVSNERRDSSRKAALEKLWCLFLCKNIILYIPPKLKVSSQTKWRAQKKVGLASSASTKEVLLYIAKEEVAMPSSRSNGRNNNDDKKNETTKNGGQKSSVLHLRGTHHHRAKKMKNKSASIEKEEEEGIIVVAPKKYNIFRILIQFGVWGYHRSTYIWTLRLNTTKT